ncbi:MAG: biopolymer transporter ExbD [Gammaproteobacteria bacterium]
MNQTFRHRKRTDTAELNITAFMNLMVILIPFLLITAVFSRLAILELNLPSSETISEEVQEFQLEITVRDNYIDVSDRRTGLLKRMKNGQDGYDFEGLTNYLRNIKKRFPSKIDATLLLEPEIPYEVLVGVMDAVRLFEAEKEGEIFKAELFPEISIGDAPVS